MLFLLFAIFVGLITFHIVTRYNRKARLLNKIPGPRVLPILGNLLLLNCNSVYLFELCRKLAKQYSIAKIWFISDGMVGTRDADHLEIILSSQKCIDKGYAYEFFHSWLKTGLLTSGGDKWRQRRKMLTPAFHFQILKMYMEITSEQGDKMIHELKKKGTDTVTDIKQMCSDFTLNIICEAAMGVALDKIDVEVVNQYKKAIYDIGEYAIQRSIKPFLTNWICPFLKIGRLEKNALSVLHKFTDTILRNRREYHNLTGNKHLIELNDITDETHNEIVFATNSRKKRLAMLDLLLLLEMKGLMNDNDIKEELDTFTFEGHDTVAIELMFTLLLLAENKEAQHKVREEVSKVLDKTDGKISLTDVNDFDYIDRCIKEAMRLYPSVPIIMRRISDDIKLDEYIIPAGAEISCFIFDLQRNPVYWPEPEKFDPDRFLPENKAKLHPYAYLPFSAGHRNCIGQKFAKLELISLVARIIYHFHLEPIDFSADIKFQASLVLNPVNPVRLKFIPIERSAIVGF